MTSYIYSVYNTVYTTVQRYIYNHCRKVKKEDFIQSIKNGNLGEVKKIYKKFGKELFVYREEALNCAHMNILSFILENIYTEKEDISKALKLASENNRTDIIIMLLRKGGDIRLAKRFSTSLNVRKAIQRFEDGTEVII
jgi:RNase P/RNase MRP subunit POP5